MNETFSARHGFRAPDAPITVREDAPAELREAILMLSRRVGLRPLGLREVICEALLVLPNDNNWPEYPNVWDEVVELMQKAPWYEIYNIVEAIYAKLSFHQALLEFNTSESPHQALLEFERRLNDFFVENGIGWELRKGKITYRGSGAFARSVHEVPDLLDESGFTRAANEMQEAVKDISRRPKPDITGAIQHAMAALEAVAREVTGQSKPTLGKLVPMLDLPNPLDKAIHKLWGYTSERGRHIREQRQTIEHSEAEFVVAIAGSLCAFMTQRKL